ncbi:MAG TPA: hypothetical protein VN442_03015 [Bryobacteraceae bacterium]|nr:hypothetical protein [Bryobacteraceae bacterium]
MTDREALEILEAQGYAVGAPDPQTGTVRVWIDHTNTFVDVKLGQELLYLAEGKKTIEQLQAERSKEAA